MLLPNMIASRVAVQGSGKPPASWLLTVGNKTSGVVGLAKVLVIRFPVKHETGFRIRTIEEMLKDAVELWLKLEWGGVIKVYMMCILKLVLYIN